MGMSLKEFLKKNQDYIMQKWFDKIVRTYDSDTASFLQTKKISSQTRLGGCHQAEPDRQPENSCGRESGWKCHDGRAGSHDKNKGRSGFYSIQSCFHRFFDKARASRLISKNQKKPDLNQSEIESLENHLDMLFLSRI